MTKARAAKAEATGESVPVEYDGAVYTVPTPMDWPLDVLDLLEVNKIIGALKLVMGADQYEEFRTSKPRTLSDATKLWESVAAASGFGNAGN
ncbi:hypothetical protein [Nonomuraea roseola]|uniref:Tail assembly chaperone n=1 Tax=Nonomuraea roseola TaxID=46179 RepID=A0ABV5Q0Q5_9ACTN